uniref:Opsin n=1 Tax=Branchiostoma belcheri TaxID=7741 RepID=Q868G4_BRABE|nr:opsin [Branchiostoma belcheri]
MNASPSSWLSSGEFFTDSPENSSEWPWTDGPTDTTWRHHQSVDSVSYEGYLASAIYITLTGLIAFFGNVITITVFLTEKEFRKKQQNGFVLNLAIADLSVCVFAYPSSAIAGYAGRWVLGDVGCTIYGFLCFTFALVSMVTLCVISIYRYILICKPQYAHLLTHRRTVYVIIGTWLYALVFTVPPLVGVKRYTYEPMQITCSLDWNVQHPGEKAYIAAVLVIVYVLQVLIMCFCYFNIIFKSANLKFAALASEKTKMAAKKDTWKTSVMCLTMVVSFLIAWTPYAVSSTWDILSAEDLPIIATILPSLFAKSSCMMNPIIYACCNTKFRQAAVKSFRKLCGMCKQKVPLSTPQVVLAMQRNTEFTSTVEPTGQAFPMRVLPSISATHTAL